MTAGGALRLAALAFAGLHATTQAAPPSSCGCAQYLPGAANASGQHAALSPQARTLRDFALFSHRRIGADLINKKGPYLDTLTAALPHCGDGGLTLSWLRQVLAESGDTRLFAERIARQVDSSRACTTAAE